MLIFAKSATPFLLLSVFGLLSLATQASPNFDAFYCSDNTTYTSNSTFQTNLNVLLSSLISNASQENGSYSTAMGFGTTNAVNGLFLCRGDVNATVCHDCVTAAAHNITRGCPNQTEAIIWYDECMMRYTNRFFRFDSLVPGKNLNDGKNISSSERDRFNQSLFTFLNDLASNASDSQSQKKFATSEVKFTSSETLYGLAQCTPDLTDDQCKTCLENGIGTLPGCCEVKQGARALLASCNIRYELFPFYNVPAAASGKKKAGSRTIVIIVVPIVVSIILFCFGSYFILRRSRRKNSKTILRENFGNESTILESLQFDLATIEAATNKFSYKNKVGRGGFGEVYKGTLSDGREIAVKRLSQSSGQGAVEFKNEILLIAKLQHRNLVTLLGFCLEQQEKILIYEYVPNKSLDYFLFDPQKHKLLNWSHRYEIIGGIARGILYLHEYSRLKVIHRDLKPSNVLLDDDMNPKISDFGLARMVAINQNQGSTNRIVGTYGYLSPEYAMHGQFSEKSDVFSFGVMVLEIISAQRNSRHLESHNADDLLSSAWRQWTNQTPLEILDPYLKDSCSQSEVIKSIQIGLLCVQENPDDRPTMATVVSYLSSPSLELPFPREPAFFILGRVQPNAVAGDSASGQSANNSIPSSVNEMSITRFLPR